MARKLHQSSFRPPYLRRIWLQDDVPAAAFQNHPLNLPVFQAFDWEITTPITIIVGANGSGKSTILEAIAANVGFALTGGTRNVAHFTSEDETLSQHLRFSWLPRVTKGFFFRAETFFTFVAMLDDVAREAREHGAPDGMEAYGGKSFRERSHGQSFMTLFEHQFGSRGFFLMDEPESALSPQWQIEFLKLMRRMERQGQAQLVIATHSPMVMAYPGATLLQVTDKGLRPIMFHETEHFRTTRNFALNPDGFMAGVMFDADEEIEQEA
jgi:predicted ATPase